MLFKARWIYDFFIWPLKRLTQKDTQCYNYNKNNNTSYTPRKKREKGDSCCVIF